MKNCKVCGQEIPAGRIKALPNATTCVQHSNADKFIANIISYGNPESDLNQEIEIIRSKNVADQLETYYKQQGTYK